MLMGTFIGRTLNRLMGYRATRAIVRSLPGRLRRPLWAKADQLYRNRLRARYRREAVPNLLHQMVRAQTLATPRYQEPGRLVRHGFKVYSHGDEDGIVEEIFRRIGTTNRAFVEVGVGYGLQNDTLYLLMQGWRGLWIEGNPVAVEASRERYRDFPHLHLVNAIATPEHVEELIALGGMAYSEPDFFSIDIDGQDYHVWRAIQHYRPRVVAIEYNASWGPTADVHVPVQDGKHARSLCNGSNYFGASLAALERIGEAKGYSLVGCNYLGTTAFFVRNELVHDSSCTHGSRFTPYFTSENHYEPARYPAQIPNGWPPGFGPVVHTPTTGCPIGTLRRDLADTVEIPTEVLQS